jgi:hypothetical protein
MNFSFPPPDKKTCTNIINFTEARAKAKQDKLFDVVATLAWFGLDEATIDELFSPRSH